MTTPRPHDARDGRPCQRMLSGRTLDILDPVPDDIDIGDIAHGLSRIARWNGQTRGAVILSVAQHSVLVEAIAGRLATDLGPAGRLIALLHDAPEYVVGDLISPFKMIVGEAYRTVEAQLFDVILRRFALVRPDPVIAAAIKRADRAAAHLEAVEAAGFSPNDAAAVLGPPEIELSDFAAWLAPQSATEAAEAFLARFDVLAAERGCPRRDP